MIRFCDSKIQLFIDFLNKNYAISPDATLCIMPSCLKLDTQDLAFYEEDSDVIIIPYNEMLRYRDDADLQLMALIAHEYKHFMNDKQGLPQDEEDCDEFAYKVISEFTNGKVKKA